MMILWFGFVLLTGASAIGAWMLFNHVRKKLIVQKNQLLHAGSGILGTIVIISWLIIHTRWQTTFNEELTATGLILALLFGIVLGLMRIAQIGTSYIVLTMHVIAALTGISGLVLILFLG